MSTPAAVALGVGLGVFVAVPLIGIGCTLLADVVHNWHLRRIAE